MNEKTSSKATNLISAIILFLLILVVLLPLSPRYNTWLRRDSGVFQYVGWRLINGDIPYKDIWDHKPPVIFLLNGIGLLIGGGSAWSVWGVELFFLCGSVAILYDILDKLFSNGTALIGSTLFLLSFPYVIQGGNLTTEYAILFTLIVYHQFLFNQSKWKLIIIGVFTGLAFLTKQNAVAAGSSVALLLTIELIIGKINWREYFISGVKLFCGFCLLLIPFLIFFLINNSLAEFWNSAFVYNFNYSSGSILDKINSMVYGINLFRQSGLTFFALFGVVVCIISVANKKNSYDSTKVFCITAVVVEVLLTGVSGRSFEHYYLALLPAMSFATGFFIEGCNSSLFKGKLFRLNGHFLAILVLIFSQLSYTDKHQFFPFSGKRTNLQQIEMVEFIVSSTEPDDEVLMVGAETAINYLSKRISPTKYVYQYPLASSGYTTDEMINEFVEDIRSNPPELIIQTNNENMNSEELNILLQNNFLNSSYCYYYSSIDKHGEWQSTPGTETWDVFICDW